MTWGEITGIGFLTLETESLNASMRWHVASLASRRPSGSARPYI